MLKIYLGVFNNKILKSSLKKIEMLINKRKDEQ